MVMPLCRLWLVALLSVVMLNVVETSGLYYKTITIVTNDASTINMGNGHVTIVNDPSSGINK
jgi:hypothetical protein